MNPNDACQSLQIWFRNLPNPDSDIPLINTGEDGVTPVLTNDEERRLTCSKRLINAIKNIGNQIKKDWAISNKSTEGMIYLVYTRDRNNFLIPRYVGIAKSAGKNGEKLSALWKNSASRFCDNRNSGGHVDLLSRALTGNHNAYSHLVDTLFLNGTYTLASAVFVHCEIWNPSAHRIHKNLPNTPLYVEEMLRIWTLREAGYGNELLNS